MKNKKGALLFAPMLLILMIVGLIYAYSEISARYKEFNKEIGEKQFELINTYGEGEKALFYIDQSAKYSSYQGIYDLAKSGGCSSGNTYDAYRLWTVDDPKPDICFPSAGDSKNNLFSFFSNNLNGYLLAYTPLGLTPNNYELSLSGFTLVGIAKNPLNIPIIEDIFNTNLGTYSIKAPFKVDIGNYDFTDYDALRLEAQEFIGACNDRSPLICVNEKKPDFFDDTLKLEKCPGGSPETKFLDFVWDSDVRYSIYGFCINKTNEPLFYAYDSEEGATGYKNIAYKFALQFRDLECTSGNPDLVGTKCMESSCDDYYDCQDATPSCYCAPGTGNACKGSCLPFCSASPDYVADADASTKCKEFSCNSYLACSSVNTCGCPDPSNLGSPNACGGAECETLHCDRDPFPLTKCKDVCSKYGDCSAATSCSCAPLSLVECTGSCYCNPQGWKDTGGCGGTREDGIDCDWSEIPQKQEYDPATCSSPDYKCNPQPLEVCPCIPETSCVELGCGVSDSCGTYCGDCPEGGGGNGEGD